VGNRGSRCGVLPRRPEKLQGDRLRHGEAASGAGQGAARGQDGRVLARASCRERGSGGREEEGRRRRRQRQRQEAEEREGREQVGERRAGRVRRRGRRDCERNRRPCSRPCRGVGGEGAHDGQETGKEGRQEERLSAWTLQESSHLVTCIYFL
jgi:hypothetical protein